MSLSKPLTVENKEYLESRCRDYSKRAGPLLLGPQLCTSPVKCVTHCLARKDGTEEFYTVKILTIADPSQCETTDDIQGKILVHTEYSLLKRLQGQKGIIQQYGLYKDVAEEEVDIGGKGYLTGRLQTRICLVLDCYMPHDYNRKFKNLVNLQQFVIKEKRLSESLAIKIFYNIVQIVCRLHKQNIVHRDLKLGNVVMDRDTKDVTLTNFGLGKQLVSEDEQLRDQRGSPAYISPAVISGKPYLGKPSDMWALGVVLYTMLYGQFPFYDSSPTELFRKIRLAEFQIPSEYAVSQPTVKLVQSLLVLDPSARSTAPETLEKLQCILEAGEAFLVDSDLQVVPDFKMEYDDDDYRPRSKRIQRPTSFPDVCGADIELMLAELSNPIICDESKSSKDTEDLVHEPPSKVARTTPALGGLSNLKVLCVDGPLKVETERDLLNARMASNIQTANNPRTIVISPGSASSGDNNNTTSNSSTFDNHSMRTADRAIVYARRRRNNFITSTVSVLQKRIQINNSNPSSTASRKRSRYGSFVNPILRQSAVSIRG